MKNMGRLERIVIIIGILVIAIGIAYAGVKNYTDFPEVVTPTSDDIVPIWEITGGKTSKVTLANLGKGITTVLVNDLTPQAGGPWDWNSQIMYDIWEAFDANDTAPEVHGATFHQTANSSATTIADFDDSDNDHSEFTDGQIFFLWINDANTTLDFTSSELEWASQGANDYAASQDDIFIFQFDSASDAGGAGWRVVSGPMPSVVAVSSLKLPQGTDPDLADSPTGKVAYDTDGANETSDASIRASDGTNQWMVAQKAKPVIQATIIKPNDLADATRDKCPIWSNETGMTFTITKIEAWADTDDTAFVIDEFDGDGASNTAEIEGDINCTTGTGPYTDTETAIDNPTIEANHTIFIDFDDTDDPGWVKITICGWFNADVD